MDNTKQSQSQDGSVTAAENKLSNPGTTSKVVTKKTSKVKFTKKISLPTAQHVSSKDTPLDNDPITEMYDIGTWHANEVVRDNTFAVRHAGLVTLSDSVWSKWMSEAQEFGKAVPEPLFCYYNAQHLWARLCWIKSQQGHHLTRSEDELLKLFAHKGWRVPAVIAAYLRGLGDVRTADSRSFAMLPPALPNRRGDYGRVDAATHILYEDHVAPRITALSVMHSIRFSTERDADEQSRNWDLPPSIRLALPQAGGAEEDEEEEEAHVDDAIAPEGGENADAHADAEGGQQRGGRVIARPRNRGDVLNAEGSETSSDEDEDVEVSPRPTRNLLGYYPAQRWKNAIISQLQSFGVTEETINHSVPTFLTNPELMSYVSAKLEASGFPCDEGPHHHREGSLAQICSQRIVDESVPQVTRQYGRANIICSTAYELGDTVGKGAAIAQYRLMKHSQTVQGTVYDPWACYSFSRYKEVPLAWRLNRNQTVEQGTHPDWLRYKKSTGPKGYYSIVHPVLGNKRSSPT